MKNELKMRRLKQKVNGLEFYCEIRGSGPIIALVPSGDGDCDYFDNTIKEVKTDVRRFCSMA